MQVPAQSRCCALVLRSRSEGTAHVLCLALLDRVRTGTIGTEAFPRRWSLSGCTPSKVLEFFDHVHRHRGRHAVLKPVHGYAVGRWVHCDVLCGLLLKKFIHKTGAKRKGHVVPHVRFS